MKAVFRLSILALAVAVAVTPLVLDSCLIACAPGTAPVTQPAHADQACHHSDTGAPLSLRDAAKSCGHDHDQAGVMASAGSTIGRSLKIAHAPAVRVPAAPVSIASRGAFDSRPTISPPTLGSLSSLTLPLRV